MWIAEGWISFFISLQFGWWSFLRSPLVAYHKARYWRDWTLAKVEYVQSESAKWRTAFTVAKMPYTILRSFGLSPQLAASTTHPSHICPVPRTTGPIMTCILTTFTASRKNCSK